MCGHEMRSASRVHAERALLAPLRLTVNAPNLRVSDAERNRVIESSSGTRPTAG